MITRMLMVLSVTAVVSATSPALAGGCKGCDKVAKSSDGFCCSKGKAFGVQLTSHKLYTALEGREVSAEDAKKCPCPDCKKALETKGSCDRCKFTGGKMYKSPVAYTLAKGMPMPAELVAACPQRCGQCKIAHKENGRCEKCGVGFVADRMFDGDAVYEAALAAFNTLKRAVSAASKCEACAVAIVTDGSCGKCDVSFKDGKIAKNTG